VLDTPKQKLELAKDVTALANASGGIIVIGFDTTRDPLTDGERISKVCAFPLNLIDSDRYRKILRSMIYPPFDIVVRVFEEPLGSGRGVAAIVINEATALDKPYLVGNMLYEDGQSIGGYIGFFERKQDVIPPITISRLHQQFSAGQQWSSINQRLLAIEANMSSWGIAGPTKKSTGISDQELTQRLKSARIAVGRDDAPIVYFLASAEGHCDFPTLFISRAQRIVRLIENPPQVRPDGFEIWADGASEIIQGALRRSMLLGHRLLDLWKDGLFIFIAPGDEDFLGWRMGGSEKPIHISNFVLAESTLVFCWLLRFIFELADPKPQSIRLTVGFDNLTRPAGPATLRDAPEARMPAGYCRAAPGPKLEVYQFAALDGYDAERLSFLLIQDIYHAFGFESVSIPFVDRDSQIARLSAIKIVGKPLSENVPTPGFS
jgi:hypothetical protein